MIGPAVIAYYLPKWALMLFAVMAFAGLTSTLDSAFSAVGSLWATDVHAPEQDSAKISRARAGMILFAFLGISIALMQPQLLWVFLVYGALAAALFFPILLTLFWEKTNSGAAFWGITLGIISGTPLSIYANVYGETELVVLAAVIGLLLPALVTIMLSKVHST